MRLVAQLMADVSSLTGEGCGISFWPHNPPPERWETWRVNNGAGDSFLGATPEEAAAKLLVHVQRATAERTQKDRAMGDKLLGSSAALEKRLNDTKTRI